MGVGLCEDCYVAVGQGLSDGSGRVGFDRMNVRQEERKRKIVPPHATLLYPIERAGDVSDLNL